MAQSWGVGLAVLLQFPALGPPSQTTWGHLSNSRYAPVVPMVLINGAEGIGTGWSTSIPNHDPEDIVRGQFFLGGGGEWEALSWSSTEPGRGFAACLRSRRRLGMHCPIERAWLALEQGPAGCR